VCLLLIDVLHVSAESHAEPSFSARELATRAVDFGTPWRKNMRSQPRTSMTIFCQIVISLVTKSDDATYETK